MDDGMSLSSRGKAEERRTKVSWVEGHGFPSRGCVMGLHRSIFSFSVLSFFLVLE